MLFTIIFYSIATLFGLAVMTAAIGSPFVAFKYVKVLDRVLPVIVVAISGGLLIVGGIINERNLQFASLGAAFIQSEGSGAYILISRFASLLVVALCVPYLFAKFMIFVSNKQKLSWPVIVTLIFGITSFILPGLLGTKPGVDHRLIYPILIMLAILVASGSSAENVLRAAKIVLVIFFVASLLFLLIDSNRVLAPGYKGFIPGLNSRFWGLANHANAIGPMAALCIFLELFVASKLRVSRWLVIGISVAVLLLAQSKTAIGATIIGLAVIFYLSGLYKKSAVSNIKGWGLHYGQIFLILGGIATLASLLVASMFGWLDGILLRLSSSGVGYGLQTFTGRDQIWGVAYQEWLRNPLFGYGTSLWDDDYRRHVGINYAFHAHNQIFQTLAESGLIGIIGMAIFLASIVYASIKLRKVTFGVSLAIFILLLFRGVTEVPLRPSSIGSGEMLLIVTLMAIWRLSHIPGGSGNMPVVALQK